MPNIAPRAAYDLSQDGDRHCRHMPAPPTLGIPGDPRRTRTEPAMPQRLLDALRRLGTRITPGQARPAPASAPDDARLPVLIYGAGKTGQQLAAALHHD